MSYMYPVFAKFLMTPRSWVSIHTVFEKTYNCEEKNNLGREAPEKQRF